MTTLRHMLSRVVAHATSRRACAAFTAGATACSVAVAAEEENPFKLGSLARQRRPTRSTSRPTSTGKAWSWPDPRTFSFPPRERPQCMFDGSTFDGWDGKIGRYWEIENGAIKATMNPADAPPVSTYLISKARHYRNFRLLFEMRMPVGNHSGVGFWGRQHRFEQENFTWKGHLAILPQTGIFDIYNRGWEERVKREGTTFGVSGDWLCKGPGTGGEGPKDVFSLHGWNQVEILCIGSRVRVVINGVCTSDWTDPAPEHIQAGPIALQQHWMNIGEEQVIGNPESFRVCSGSVVSSQLGPLLIYRMSLYGLFPYNP